MDDLDDFRELIEIPELAGWAMYGHRPADLLEWYISQYDNMDIDNHIVCLALFDKETGNILGSAGVGRHDVLVSRKYFIRCFPVCVVKDMR